MKGGPGRGQWPTAGDKQSPREATTGTDLNHKSWFTWDCCGEITQQKTASLLPGCSKAAGEVLAGTALGPCPQQVSAVPGAAGGPGRPLAVQLCALTWRQEPFASLLPRNMARGLQELCRAQAAARAPDPGCPPGEFPQCAWPAVWSWLCFFRVCLSVLFFLPVVCMKLATYTCVASMCESKPRAYPELWTVSCLILLVIFCQLLNFRVCIPFPVSSWTGPVPGRAEWQHTRTLLLPDAIHHRWAVGFSCTAFQTAAWMPSAGTRSAPLPGCVTQPLKAVWEAQVPSAPVLLGRGGGARRYSWRWGTVPARAGQKVAPQVWHRNLALFASGQRWEGPAHVIAYAHVFMHSVLLLVSQSLSVGGAAPGGACPPPDPPSLLRALGLVPQLCAAGSRMGTT